MKKIPVRNIKTSLKETGSSESFTIRDISTLLSGKDMVQELHRHNFYFVLVVEKGAGEHTIDFTPYSIGDYSVFFLRPGQVHQLTLKKGSTGYLMAFNTDFYSAREKPTNQVLRKVSSRNYCQLSYDRFKKLISISANIFQELSLKQERYEEVIKANLEIFFIELARQSQDPKKLSNDSNNYTQERLEQLLELLETHISTHKQVAQYADMLHLTSYQLNAIIKTMLGKTCSELINEYIILESKRYLLATSNQVNQIANHLGYEDISYFIRFFKKHTGYTPETFRQNFK
ncbi:MAG: AraC family transcriptional regulator [Chitinophagaceae bacterium]